MLFIARETGGKLAAMVSFEGSEEKEEGREEVVVGGEEVGEVPEVVVVRTTGRRR